MTSRGALRLAAFVFVLLAILFYAVRILKIESERTQAEPQRLPNVGETFRGRVLSVTPVSDAVQKPAQALSDGRYVFYLQPRTQGRADDGYLLDTATGDMWLLGQEHQNGKTAKTILVPVTRTPQPMRLHLRPTFISSILSARRRRSRRTRNRR
jgi:hypothetical protein